MNTILILAQDGDCTADEVFQWINYLSDARVIRINETDTLDLVNISTNSDGTSEFTIVADGTVAIHSTEITAYWYRRGSLTYSNILNKEPLTDPIDKSFTKSLNSYYLEEWKRIADYIHFLLQTTGARRIDSFFNVEVNKMINLEVAKKCGLAIPASLISNDKNAILSFFKNHSKIITKPIHSSGASFYTPSHKYAFSQKTNVFTIEGLNEVFKIKTHFQPTLFQEYLQKEFEVRTFYKNKKFYSMAIFSQQNEKTQVDFRDYDDIFPNRNVPYQLPAYMEFKLTQFMEYWKYDTGSIDLIYDKGVYTFLEVNTVGQFRWLSKNCNYNLEREIALDLLNASYENNRI